MTSQQKKERDKGTNKRKIKAVYVYDAESPVEFGYKAEGQNPSQKSRKNSPIPQVLA